MATTTTSMQQAPVMSNSAKPTEGICSMLSSWSFLCWAAYRDNEQLVEPVPLVDWIVSDPLISGNARRLRC